MVGYPEFAVVGELGSDGVKLYSLLLLTLLHLPFTISGVNWPECFRLRQNSWKQVDLCNLGYSRPPESQAFLSLVRAGLLCPWLKQTSCVPVSLCPWLGQTSLEMTCFGVQGQAWQWVFLVMADLQGDR